MLDAPVSIQSTADTPEGRVPDGKHAQSRPVSPAGAIRASSDRKYASQPAVPAQAGSSAGALPQAFASPGAVVAPPDPSVTDGRGS